jgi:hypothetical protein
MQHPLIYFYNIYKKQLHHTFETIKTPETYICNKGEESLVRSIPAVGARAAAHKHHHHHYQAWLGSNGMGARSAMAAGVGGAWSPG